MCAVSAINDWGRLQFPQWQQPLIPAPNPYAPLQQTLTWPTPQFTDEEVKLMKKFLALMKGAAELDEAAGLPNCEDPEKVKFQEAVEKRLTAVESYLEKFKKAAAGSAEA